MNKNIFKSIQILLFYGFISSNILSSQITPISAKLKFSIKKVFSNQEIGNLSKTAILDYFEILKREILLEEFDLAIEELELSNIKLDLSSNNLFLTLETINEKLNCDFLFSLLKEIVFNKKLTHLDLSYNGLFNTDIYTRLQKLNPDLKIRMCIF